MRILKVKDWLRLHKENKELERREVIIKKWEESGLLDGLKGHSKSNIAQLYEAQATCLLSEVPVWPSSDTFRTTEQS